MKNFLIFGLLTAGFYTMADNIKPANSETPTIKENTTAGTITTTAEKPLNITPAISTKSELSADRFIFLTARADFVFNERIVDLRESIGYGQNIILNNNYFGFFSIALNFNFFLNSLESVFGSDKSFLWSFKDIFFELKYGWEFMKDRIVSFGVDTAHGLGTISLSSGGCAITYYPAFAFSNAIGVFARVNSGLLSLTLHTGIQHHNAFEEFMYIITDKNFGPYVHLGLKFNL